MIFLSDGVRENQWFSIGQSEENLRNIRMETNAHANVRNWNEANVIISSDFFLDRIDFCWWVLFSLSHSVCLSPSGVLCWTHWIFKIELFYLSFSWRHSAVLFGGVASLATAAIFDMNRCPNHWSHSNRLVAFARKFHECVTNGLRSLHVKVNWNWSVYTRKYSTARCKRYILWLFGQRTST